MLNLRVKQIFELIRKDFVTELRQQNTLYGIFLYVFSTIFVIYMSIGEPEEQVWNGLFWISQLFVSINAVAKGFLQESNGRMLYFYSIAHPVDFILAKLIYNAMIMLLMTLLSVSCFCLFLGNPLHNLPGFLLLSILGGTGFGILFSFLSAIALKSKQSASVIAILGFPLIIPQILLLMKISIPLFSPVVQEGFLQLMLALLGLDILILLLALILFPFLWKE